MPDGQLEYLGRNDFQVKIRGLRIELDEIEHRLLALDDVRQAVVTVADLQGEPALSAYVVTHSQQPLNEQEAAAALSQHLPQYMLPTCYTYMAELPVTINGKLNRKALPAPNILPGQGYVAPSTSLERVLCEIWQEVLGLEQVGIEDNFFRLGGNSLSAIRLLAITKKKANQSFELADLFTKKTIRYLAAHCAVVAEKHIVSQSESLSPVSFAQQRMLFIEQFENGTDAYHLPYFVQLNDETNTGALLAAIEAIAERHQILKSVYEEHPELGDVQRQIPGTIPVYPVTLVKSADLTEAIRNDIARPFDLSREYPFRLHHYTQGEHQYLLFLWHHIAFDGWSTEIFLSELARAYPALCKQQSPELPQLSIQYSDYAQWQRDQFSGEALDVLSSYWTGHLKGYENISLPTDKPRPAQVRYDGDEHLFALGDTLSEQLRELARLEETTLYNIMLSAFYVTMSRLSGQDDIVIGTPSDNRHHEQTHSVIGLFANTLALRNHVTPTLTVQHFIQQVQQTVLAGKQHQEMPFDRLVSELEVERDLSRHPVFQVMFMLQSFGQARQDLPFKPLGSQGSGAFYTAAKFDLTLAINDAASNLECVLNFSTHLFEKPTIERFAAVYQHILQGFVARPHQLLAELPCMSPQDENTLLVEWNRTRADFPRHLTLHRCFEQQVERTPGATALIFQHHELSYRELNHRANQLAAAIRDNYQHLHGRPLKPDTPIMLYLERSLEMVVGILAVLKAGAAYVPVSPEFPQERTLFMVQDTETPVILTQHALQPRLDEWVRSLEAPPSVLCIDDAAAFAAYPADNLPAYSSPDDLAYILYTSGTTGQPKGVMIEQRSVMNLVCSQRQTFDFSNRERVLLLSSYVFDASVEQVFMSLLSGAQLVIASKLVVGDPSLVHDTVIQHSITHLHTTPAYLAELSNLSKVSTLKRVISGGDKCTAVLKQTWGKRLVNEYGPTETTVTALNSLYDDRNKLVDCIGRPLGNTQIYILSENQNPLPIGAPGELYIGGDGVARGYLNRPDLTRASFILNPFVKDTGMRGERLYRTGDIVRWLPDGEVEFIGRKDSQIKLRGYRIELGEIESLLNSMPEVKQTCVRFSQSRGHQVIVAYVAFVDLQNSCISSLRQSLELRLPDYMIPKYFVTLASLPLTVNGKVDKSALPEPAYIEEVQYIAPENDLESQLCKIWQDILGIEKIGILDNFFKVGGDSILAVKVMAKINSLLQCTPRLEVHLIFSFQSIGKLSQEIEIQLQQRQLTKSEKRMTL
ncbi:amino acid adenylation domain-containing protein [Pantoea agglomerans]|uniref:amino acid adenylation domain-containing protein n=2 Tax=Enterobacter agglomerans TaxID=549 RepID=UPI0021757166|nr:amino acid adenylation domain-containing protein [Pantoea agglomerans]